MPDDKPREETRWRQHSLESFPQPRRGKKKVVGRQRDRRKKKRATSALPTVVISKDLKKGLVHGLQRLIHDFEQYVQGQTRTNDGGIDFNVRTARYRLFLRDAKGECTKKKKVYCAREQVSPPGSSERGGG